MCNAHVVLDCGEQVEQQSGFCLQKAWLQITLAPSRPLPTIAQGWQIELTGAIWWMRQMNFCGEQWEKRKW